MFTKTEVGSAEFKIFTQETRSSRKTWFYDTFDVSCLGESKMLNHTLLYEVVKKGKREDSQDKRMARFAEHFVERTQAHLRQIHQRGHLKNQLSLVGGHVTGNGALPFEQFYGKVIEATRHAMHNFCKLGGWDISEIEQLAEDTAGAVVFIESELGRIVANWDKHGILEWNDYSTLPMYNLRQKLDEFLHDISANKLHRLHVAIHDHGERGATVMIGGRQLAAKKKITAQINLLAQALPHLVSSFADKWTFRGGEGRQLALQWRDNFYTDVSFRSMMEVEL